MAEKDASPVRNDSFLWALPDVVLFHVLRFCAAPTLRATVVCHQLALTCRSGKERLFESTALWETLLHEDYGAEVLVSENRRTSKRLRRSPRDRVCDAHRLIQMHTEIAYFHISELAQSTKGSLSRSEMVRILQEYGPNLRINALLSTGGTLLVEVCRARNISEAAIFNCVQELVERWGALTDVSTSESPSSRMTALCVAAARGMPKLVLFLLQKGASLSIQSSGRFRLTAKPTRSVHCRNQTALEFARTLEQAEIGVGAKSNELSSLRKVIRLLSNPPR